MIRTLITVAMLALQACDADPQPDEHADHAASAGADQTAADGPQAPALFTCGMHPEVVQDHPGECPICGMELEPIRRGGDGPVVEVDAGTRLVMGVRTALVQRRPVYHQIRTVGQVEVGEDELSVVNLRFGGWVEGLRVERTGDPVQRGQVLFEIYAPDLVAAQEELLLARRRDDHALEASVRRKLELWGLSSRDVEGIVTSGLAQRTLPIRAPSSGYVLHKNLMEGARVEAGKDLFRIGQLERIWVVAEVYEYDAPWVEEGQPTQVELPWQPGVVLEGQVAYVYPTLDPQTRTLQVRLELDNPGVKLKPGMFAKVTIQVRRQEAVLTVPDEAILHSGTRQLVFLVSGDGRYEAREVRTGLAGADRHTEVLDGLDEGDEIVVSGQFLIDAESQLQEALQGLASRGGGEAELHASMGHSHGDHAPSEHATHGEGPAHPDGARYRSDQRYTCPMHPEVIQSGPGRCPECKMFLEVMGDATHYTCPMHPEVSQERPGRCPECKMFLEAVPVTP
jgi:Cu(I)/Ag(I) efflux system membrane fusion protein